MAVSISTLNEKHLHKTYLFFSFVWDNKRMAKIESLTQEQIDKFPMYVDHWTSVGRATGPANLEEAKKHISTIYTNVKFEAPKYYFHFQSPKSSVNAIFMVEALSDFGPNYTSKEVFGDISNWKPVFDEMYKQYSEQYHEIEWNQDVYERMLSKVSKAYSELEPENNKLVEICQQMLYGNQESFWLSYYDFFLKEFGAQADFCLPIQPFIDLSYHVGWWSAYQDVVFIQDRPMYIHINDANLLHCATGPAVEYSDGYKVYALSNYLVDPIVIESPELLTTDMIEKESNAEVRRMMMEIYGMDRYFDDSGCEVLDRDFTVVDRERKISAPRMLIKTRNGDIYLAGSDGSTERVYYMPIQNLEAVQSRTGIKVTTCRQAHELICGVKESQILGQS